MSLFHYVDPRLGLDDREIPAERIDYHVLAKDGSFYRPGDWRRLDPDTGRTAQFVDDATWRSQYRPASIGAMLAWDQICWPPKVREDLPEDTVRALRAEGHHVLTRTLLS